jgi:hypothetical protein
MYGPCFNKIVRTACGGFLLMLTDAISGSQVGSISFDGQTFPARDHGY